MRNKGLQGIAAFNLLEIMLVIVVMTILLAYAIPSWMQFRKEQSCQNAAAELARDLDYARSLSLQYEETTYIAFSGTGASTYSIYKATAVTGGSTIGRPNYGRSTDPFLVRDLRKQYGGPIVISGVTGNLITLSTNGAPATAVTVNVQYLDSSIQTTLTFQTTGRITFESEGL